MIKLFILFFLVFSDFYSKKIIFNFIDLNSFFVINQFIDITHIHNFGISFGLFSGVISPLFIMILGLLITFILFLIFINTSKNLEKWGYLLIISGAISNIFDRFLNGYVIDFIYIHYKDFYWPAFNLADIYISIGVMIIVIQLLKDIKKKVKK